MKRFISLGVITALLAFSFVSVTATEAETPYKALRNELLAMQHNHQLWVDYLEANPRAYIPSDVGSLAWQREAVKLYDARIFAIDLLNQGYKYWSNGESIYETTLADFKHHRAVHLWFATQPNTYNDSAMQYHWANNYSWRIAMLNTLR
jgi:hypothetical protein